MLYGYETLLIQRNCGSRLCLSRSKTRQYSPLKLSTFNTYSNWYYGLYCYCLSVQDFFHPQFSPLLFPTTSAESIKMRQTKSQKSPNIHAIGSEMQLHLYTWQTAH